MSDLVEELSWTPEQVMSLTPAQFFSIACRYDDLGRPRGKDVNSFAAAQQQAKTMRVRREKWTHEMTRVLRYA